MLRIKTKQVMTACHLHYVFKHLRSFCHDWRYEVKYSTKLTRLFLFTLFRDSAHLLRDILGIVVFVELHAILSYGIETVFPRSPRDTVRETRPRGARWAETRLANPELVGGNKGGARRELLQLEHVVGKHNTCSWLDDVSQFPPSEIMYYGKMIKRLKRENKQIKPQIWDSFVWQDCCCLWSI